MSMSVSVVLSQSLRGTPILPEDVEDDLVREDIVLPPAPSILKLQAVSKPIDLSVAKVGLALEV